MTRSSPASARVATPKASAVRPRRAGPATKSAAAARMPTEGFSQSSAKSNPATSGRPRSIASQAPAQPKSRRGEVLPTKTASTIGELLRIIVRAIPLGRQ